MPIKAPALLRLIVLCIPFLIVACADGQRVSAGENVPLGRLPADVKPLHYHLQLEIDPRDEHFSGLTRIEIELASARDRIWLHGKNLQVDSVVAILPDEREVSGEYQQVANVGVAQLHFPELLPAGKAILQIEYRAPFNTSLEGLYKVRADGEDYAFTQFEATSARFAFPSFDEPAFKTPFDITLIVDPEHKAVSSTPILDEEDIDGQRHLRFATTKPLPTYLIAFAVGPLDQVAGQAIPTTALRDRLVPFKAYAVKGKGEQLKFALENTADIVISQEDYFGYPYPFQKLALIAVPDFGAGAMENVGAITYREQRLLITEETPLEVQQRFFLTHAHELAHQWFGNLVTPEWWNDIWLNEAFATWMASKTMHQLQPEAGYAQRMLDRALATMEMDKLISARQIRQPVTSHAEIGAAFDGITYDKGGAVLAMLEAFVGEEAFKQGIQNYMRDFAFQNADARDFVQSIAAVRPDLPEGQVEAAFFSFLEQPGTPLVNVDWNCDEEKVSVTVEQSRYLPLGSEGDPNQQWVLPLCLAYDAEGERQSHCILINQAQARIELPGKACPTSIVPNVNAAGYYRWSMSPEHWRGLLHSDLMNAREQLAAANSLSAAFHNGKLSAAQYLELLPALLDSNNAQVLIAPLSDLYLMERHLLEGAAAEKFRQQIAELYRPIYQQLSLDKGIAGADQPRLRNAVLRLYALLLEDAELRAQLRKLAVKYSGFGSDRKLHPDGMDPNLRELALATAVSLEGRDFADLLLQHFHDSNNAVLREEILRALSWSNDPDFRAALRELSLSERVRDNEVVHILESLMQREESKDETWTWLRSNMDAVIARSPSWFQGRVIEYASGFCSESRYREIKTELADRISELQRGPRSLATTLERIQLCAALAEQQGPALRAALSGGL